MPRGRKSRYAGQKILKLTHRKRHHNPRRKGSIAYDNWWVYKDNMTYEQYRTAGGRLRDLIFDIEHGYVKIID